ncbi:MAG: hypothetical protein EAZ89_13585 [Bacteroidetes bacterium]|nr:MAG: hypothetical protein EAZ89_13585 [Bacteroidota bacterium]
MIISEDNRIVHGLWIGGDLSPLEILTIKSFQAHGHIFILWTYDGIKTPLPEGTVLRDANEVLDRSHIFSYKHVNEWGHGRGSYAGFSDIFRYKLLYEHGGWWTDMDITCLQPLLFSTPYVFRNHDVLQIVGNLLKCPPKSELMKACFERGVREVNADNTYWLKPVEILNEEIVRLHLTHFIHHHITNDDKWDLIVNYIKYGTEIPQTWYAIHWMNEMWRTNNLPKNKCFTGSSLALLHHNYHNTAHIFYEKKKNPESIRMKAVKTGVKRKIKDIIIYLFRKIGKYDQLKKSQFLFHYYRKNRNILRYDISMKLNKNKAFLRVKPLFSFLYRMVKPRP